MKIIIPTFERIEWMPPTISMIEALAEMGYDVAYITVYPDSFFERSKYRERIHNVSLCSRDLTLQYRIPYRKVISGLLFRVDILVKKIVSLRLNKVISLLMDDDALLWVVNEMTVLLGGSRFLKNREYAFTIYELHEKKFKNRNIERAAKRAKVTIVPEYCRAHIMQSRYQLEKTPMVLPNKTEIEPIKILSQKAKDAIGKLESLRKNGQIPVLYMGGINKERPLEPVLEAIKDNPKFRLVVMGRESVYLQELTARYRGAFDYLGAFVPPEHIQVAAHAGIGLLMYVSINQSQGLNAIFCAPNKIYEYAGQGLPVIGNDIPGLKYPIELSGIGKVVDFTSKESVKTALEAIYADYEGYSQRAKEFHEQTDVNRIIHNVLDTMGSTR